MLTPPRGEEEWADACDFLLAKILHKAEFFVSQETLHGVSNFPLAGASGSAG